MRVPRPSTSPSQLIDAPRGTLYLRIGRQRSGNAALPVEERLSERDRDDRLRVRRYEVAAHADTFSQPLVVFVISPVRHFTVSGLPAPRLPPPSFVTMTFTAGPYQITW